MPCFLKDLHEIKGVDFSLLLCIFDALKQRIRGRRAISRENTTRTEHRIKTEEGGEGDNSNLVHALSVHEGWVSTLLTGSNLGSLYHDNTLDVDKL